MREWILAWRSMVRRPGFVAAAVLILALGIGANTATFSMVDAVLLKPLPYPNPDRLGRHFQWTDQSVADTLPTEIVGVAREMREDTLTLTPAPYVYSCIAPGNWPDPEYVVRTQGDPRALMQAIRPMVHSLDPSRAVFGMKPLGDVLEGALEQPRLNTRMIALFAAAAIALAAVGLYSLVMLIVTARTREIGVRMTLGAEPGQIVRQLLFRMARLLGAGLAGGLVLTLFADRVLRSVLYGVSPADVLTLSVAMVVLAAVAIVATLVPARRAAHIDPLQAIRTE